MLGLYGDCILFIWESLEKKRASTMIRYIYHLFADLCFTIYVTHSKGAGHPPSSDPESLA